MEGLGSGTLTRPASPGWPRLISDLLSPPVVWGLLAFPIAFHSASGGRALGLVFLYVLCVVWLPLLYILFNVRSGAITDIHLRERRERLRPFAVSILGAACALAALALADAPRVMLLLALITVLEMALIAAITVVWQISMHTMSIASAVVAIGVLYGPAPAAILLPLVALVGLGRYRLGRHDLSQILAGAALGAAVPLFVLTLA